MKKQVNASSYTISRGTTAELVHGVEALRAAADLHDSQRLALCGAHAAKRQRYPVNLRFHDAGHGTVPFGRTPDHALGPGDKIAQLFHLRVIGLGIIRQGKARGAEGARLRPKTRQDAGSFLGH